MKKHFIHFLCFLLILSPILAQKISKDKKAIIVALDQKEAFYQKTALTIWNYAEIGYQEYKSSQLLQDILENEVIQQKFVPGIPTGFVASYGSGKPVISMLAEFDALPGVSQEAVPFRKERADGHLSGHACGHHLFGTGIVSAAVEVKNWMAK